MGRLLRVSLFAASALCSVSAQDAAPVPPLPTPMQAAVKRLSKILAAQSLITTKPATQVESFSKVCSVPLLEMRIDDPDRFTAPRIPGPTNVDPMPRAELPAPPCK